MMEVRMARNAKDDAERQRERARLYAPPRQTPKRRRKGVAPRETAAPAESAGPAAGGMSLAQAQAMAAEVAAEDATLARR